MDPVSQASAGAALAASTADCQRVLAAGALGLLSGLAPDLDVLIRSPTDPLLFLEYHRQFTHALAFVPVGALLCALLAYPMARRWLTWRQAFAFCLLGYGSHGLLDACTSYGTQLWWPFSDARVAWNAVSVVDPLLTLPLVGAVALAMVLRRAGPARVGLGWVILYLLVGAAQGQRAQQAAVELAMARGHEPRQLLVKPSFGNVLVWKSVYADGDWYYADALRVGLNVSYYPGERIAALNVSRDLPWLEPGSVQAVDVARFARFSEGYLAMDPANPDRVIDMRYSLLPNSVDALWGVELERNAPGCHVRFVTDRSTTPTDRQALLLMLRQPGLPLDRAAAQSW